MSDAQMKMRPFEVTLVHGTWGRHFRRTWFGEGSTFREQFSQELTRRGWLHRVSSFLWSGANSIRDRDSAGRQLASHLVNQRIDNPDCIQVVIAHSHGGNVAGRALSYLPPEHPKTLVATLATPFLEIHPLAISLKHRLPVFFMFMAMPLWIYFELARPWVPKTIRFWAPYQYFELLFLFLMLPSLFTLIASWYMRSIRNTESMNELRRATSLQCLSQASHSLLVLRAIDDEASLSIALGAVVNRLLAGLGVWSVMLVCCAILIWGSIFVPHVVAVLLFGRGLDHSSLFAAVLAYSQEGVYGSILFVAAAWLLVLGSRWVYGREMVLAPLGCQVSMQSAPDGKDVSQVITLVEKGIEARLRHFIYEHDECVPAIGAWLDRSIHGGL